jgi:hypothetical protein
MKKASGNRESRAEWRFVRARMKEYWIAVREFFGVAQPEIIVVSSLIIGQDVISFDDVPKERYATRANTIRMVTLRQFAERIPKTTVVFNRPRRGLAAPQNVAANRL